MMSLDFMTITLPYFFTKSLATVEFAMDMRVMLNISNPVHRVSSGTHGALSGPMAEPEGAFVIPVESIKR